MKYVYIVVFNLVALYLMVAFVFGNGGVLDNVHKMNRITELQAEQMEDQIELEGMRARLAYLKSLSTPDPNLLAQNGRKFENTVIFKFDAPSEIPERLGVNWRETMEKVETKVFLFIGIVAALMIFGNVVLILNFKRAV